MNKSIELFDNIESRRELNATTKRQSKNEDKKDLEYWKKSSLAFEKRTIQLQEKILQLELEINSLRQKDELLDYNIEKAIQNFINSYDLKSSKQQKNWISTQEIFLVAKNFLDEKNKNISIKKFSLIFGKILGINSVIGGSKKKHKGFLIESSSILFFAIKSR